MKFSRRWKYLGVVVVSVLILGALFVWHMGGVLVAPANHIVDRAPANLHVEDVEFPSASGAMIRGWFAPGKTNRGVVILLHGIRADRMAMVPRAQFLVREGFSVLLFDFQAHGESSGKQITFGYLESRDAAAAVDFIHEKCPGERVGVIGVSMGAVWNPAIPTCTRQRKIAWICGSGGRDDWQPRC
jgi:pimeloyl-ACP methyl ester carboxylesterase